METQAIILVQLSANQITATWPEFKIEWNENPSSELEWQSDGRHGIGKHRPLPFPIPSIYTPSAYC